MTSTQAPPIVALPPISPLDTAAVAVKMEDNRKRALAADGVDDSNSGHRKKPVKDENGQQMRMDAEKEKEIENYQKDAILRQMKEYKRQRKDLEEQVCDMQKKCEYHDDHLRAIDAWFAQLLDEVRLMAIKMLPSPPPNLSDAGEELYNSALLFADNALFSEHLHTRSASIRRAITDLFGRIPSASPEVEELRRQLNSSLAKEKEHAVELRKAIDDKDSISERLEAASYRYMTAEKKLDRAKSSQVLKLEKAAMMSSAPDSSPTTSKKAATPKTEHSEMNGGLENGEVSAEAEAAKKEALALAERRKAQLDEIEAENDRLTNDLSAARTRLASLSSDDYAGTSLFKNVRSQYESVVNRVNDLESTNAQIRQENQKLQAERTSYRSAVDDENRINSIETETQLARTENDLSRVRGLRDDLQAELTVRKAAEENRRVAADQAKELAAARDSRIAALESEVERLKLRSGDSPAPELNLDDLDPETLKTKLRTIEGQYALLVNELPSMEAAWKKTSILASRKVLEIADFEEQIARLSAEKNKANQKFFDTMKVKDLQGNELRALKTSNLKSGELITQLKESERQTRELVANLERQLVESKETLAKADQQYRVLEQKHKETSITCDGLKKQMDDLKALISAQDREALDTKKGKREAEEEAERAKSRLEDAKKQLDALRKSKSAMASTGSDDWRKVAICPVCNTNIRNTVIKLCGHVFCKNCVQDLISNRSRKCPSCGRAFGNGDHMGITLT